MSCCRSTIFAGLQTSGTPENNTHPRRDSAGGASACQKSFFDKLSAVFQNLKSSEKPVIANERHP